MAAQSVYHALQTASAFLPIVMTVCVSKVTTEISWRMYMSAVPVSETQVPYSQIPSFFFCFKGPPSACRNFRVLESRTRANTITVMWEHPLITGRDDYYYNIHHSNPDLPGSFVQHNLNPLITSSPLVRYSVSGLQPQTRYTIRLSVHNGVSEQDLTGEEGRRSEVTATTGDISKRDYTLINYYDSYPNIRQISVQKRHFLW